MNSRHPRSCLPATSDPRFRLRCDAAEPHIRRYGKWRGVLVYPLLCRAAKKAGILVTAPFATSHPEDWCATFADRPFIPRRERIPPFKIDASAGQAFGTLLCSAEVTFFSRFEAPQLSSKKAVEMTLSFRLPSSDRMTFAEVAHRPSYKSVIEMVVIGGGKPLNAVSFKNPLR